MAIQEMKIFMAVQMEATSESTESSQDRNIRSCTPKSLPNILKISVMNKPKMSTVVCI
jgi:hypothetical protein